MKVFLLFVIGFTVTTSIYGASKQDDIVYGTYACVAQRVVGIQGEGSSRHHGSIKLREEKLSFLLTITKIKKEDRMWCYMDDDPPLKRDPFYHWWECESRSKATFSKEKYPLPFRGDGKHVFLESVNGTFHISIGGKYTFSYNNLAGNFYLEEGICKLIM